MIYTPRLDKAIRTSATAHYKQFRKGSNLPYVSHPFAVMYIASKVTDDEDTLIACLFHDILEDVPAEYPRVQMLDEFGEHVVSIVEGVTKDETVPGWQDRSDAYLAHLSTAADESVIVSAADKIHNLQSMLIDYEIIGDELWKRFNAGKERQLWWYESVLGILQKRIPESPLTSELADHVGSLRQIV